MAESVTAGDVVADRYRLVKVVGEGAVGVVWRAERTSSGEPVALKLLRDDIESETLRERFVDEARAARGLASEHVVQIHEAGEHDGLTYLAMELLEGEDLGQRLTRGNLSQAETWALMKQTGEAVSAAHGQGMVHRDLKPANIFLCEPEGAPRVKILDFGVAKLGPLLDGDGMTNTGDQLGTPSYMSPEQLRSSKDVDHLADLWALGVVAYHCLVGQKPFDAKKYGELVLAICLEPSPVPSSHGEVPPGFDAWFARACAKKPEDRFPSCDAMMAELEAALG